ncbi:MAG: TM2 domain-containing protein [Planctomycetes bacterium]|nr:TM2 domain-containing protein [Planctomycetota bacterium]
MPDPRIQLKNPLIAGILAYLLPGVGHLYQGRFFKGVLYLVCILGSFLSGMVLAEGKVVYLRKQSGNLLFLRMQQGPTTWRYISQILVGLPALPALFQSNRYANLDQNRKSDGLEPLQRLSEPVSTTFSGRIARQNVDGEIVEGAIEGEIRLTPVPGSNGSEVTGTFRGTFEGGEHIELSLSSPISVGPKVIAGENISLRFLGEDEDHHKKEFSGRRRYLMCQIAEQTGDTSKAGFIEGTIPRNFWDWFEVPLEESAEQYLHREVGKRYEVAMVFTWIAGLLNILAIWDAVQGPAYGYGDEEQPDDGEEQEDESEKPASGSTQPSPSQAEVTLDPNKKPRANSQAGRSTDPSINPRQ